MKRIILTVIGTLLLAVPVFSQNLVADLLGEAGREAAQNTMQINVSGRMLEMAANGDKSIDADTKKLFQSIKKISAVIGLSLDDKLQKSLNKKLASYEELLSVIENGQTISMYTKEAKKGVIEEFILCVASEDQMLLLSITGNITLKQLSQLSKDVNIEGMEHLEKINSKTKK